jgi:glucuronyl/N-acetylglucosaminyl transferase EXT2
MEAIEESEFYTDDPSQACIFIPPVDLLSERNVDVAKAGAALASTQYWGGGLNNLVFSMLPGSPPDFQPALGVAHGRAMVAGAGLSSHTFRMGFDVALPTFSHAVQALNMTRPISATRKWLLVSTQIRYGHYFCSKVQFS